MAIEPYTQGSDEIYRPPFVIDHREDEYDSSGFDVLAAMEKNHFWYRGRRRFLLRALSRYLRFDSTEPLAAVDLGGGTGGWISCLVESFPRQFAPLALADSSAYALTRTAASLPSVVLRCQADLMNLQWSNTWDVVFLLDVIEHLQDDLQALRQAGKALKPGGTMFVSVPALDVFWSYNDVVSQHQRRYHRRDFVRLASESDLQLVDVRYFMFFLSPVYWLSRRITGNANDDPDTLKDQCDRAHTVPARPLNAFLSGIFMAETPIGHWMRFPWGTSLLGVFRKS